MKIYSDRAKLALYRNVFILFEIIICLPINHIKDEVSLIHPLWKIKNSFKIYRRTKSIIIFSFELKAFSLYKNIFNLMPTYNVCQKNDHLWKFNLWQNLKILTPKFKSTQFVEKNTYACKILWKNDSKQDFWTILLLIGNDKSTLMS